MKGGKMNELQIFNSPEFGQVRTVEINSKPYFVAIDVAKSLGYKDATKAIKQHCRWVAKCPIPHPQSAAKEIEVNCIPEGDIYRLIAHSELPSAQKFESWIFDEVLPSIRKTGMYAVDELLNNPDMAIKAFSALKEEREKNKVLLIDNQRMRPKEIFADAVSASHTSILIGDLAKLIKQNGIDIGQKRLFAWLRENGYLIKRKGADYNMPTQKSMDLSLFEVKETTITHSDGHTTISRTTKVTGKGQQYFINKFLSKRAG